MTRRERHIEAEMIAYENGDFWATSAKHGWEVYENGLTHSVRRAIIGYKGQEGLLKAMAKADQLADAKLKD
jgi:hypothetical protein